MPQEQTWTLSAVNVAPSVARKAVRDFLTVVDLPPRDLDDVLLCVSEAVTNVVIHAYRDQDEPGRVCLRATINNGELCISVQDNGTGLQPRLDSPGMGVGLPLISRLATSVDIHADETTGTEVVMRFLLDDAQAA